MEIVLVVLFLVGVGAAGKSAYDSVRDSYRESKAAAAKAASGKKGKRLTKSHRTAVAARHAQGFWAGEILHGFPMARRGWHTGWLAHKAAADHARALREEARTSHLETRASVLSGIPEHRKRQAEAQEQIEKALAEHPDATSRKAVKEAAGAVVLPFPDRPAPPLPAEVGKPEPGPYAPKPADDLAAHLKAPMPDPRLNDRQRERDRTGKGNACAACGSPGTSDDPLVVAEDGYRVHRSHTTDASSGYFDPAAIDFNRADYDLGGDPRLPPGEAAREPENVVDDATIAADHGFEGEFDPCPEPPATTPSPASNGNGAVPMASETRPGEVTYTSVINGANAAIAESDQDSASIRSRKDAAYALADEMVAADVDSSVIDAQMARADALGRAEAALAEAGEHAASTATSVQRYHGQMDEAHRDAPGKIATREFHGEG